MSTSNFKNADSILSVTLRKNQFSAEENSFIGRVTRNTVTLENLIASISEKNAGVSPYMIQMLQIFWGFRSFRLLWPGHKYSRRLSRHIFRWRF